MKTTFFLIIILMSISCKRRIEKDKKHLRHMDNQECFNPEYKTEIINSIFESNYILKQMDPRVKNSKLELKILKNDFLKNDIEMKFRKMEVKFVDSVNLSEDTYRITFSNISCNNKSLSFNLYYPIEGNWFAQGQIQYQNGQWVTDILSGGIAD